MQAFRKFSAQKMVNCTLAFDPALATKGLRNYPDTKVGSARGHVGARPLDGMSMTCVLVRFVYYFNGDGSKGGMQDCLDTIARGHFSMFVQFGLSFSKVIRLRASKRAEKINVFPEIFIMPEP